ncbi:MAG: glutamine-hydrolyzing carbamoyl-phosphate synthase small subunit [Acidimicrobiales bacterium]
MSVRPEALLVLSDGTVFEGEAAGALAQVGTATGELVFNTALSGYQEVVTDPSYAGQVIAFTYPHIGNYGTSAADDEAGHPFCNGVVVRDLVPIGSNWRSEAGFEDYLVRAGVPVITGVDTRRLTRHVREAGALPCAMGTADEATLRAAAAAAPSTTGRDLVSEVTIAHPMTRGSGPARVVVFDFGVKETMVRHLSQMATLTIVPASTSAADVLAREPHGVFLSNGPGDPAPLEGPVATIAELLGQVPIFGICLGHQLLGLAMGGSTYKLHFGHHGTNHPVRRLATGTVEITSQNHNYALEAGAIPGAQITHVNLNDGVVEGISVPSAAAFSVQYHPEAGPGPHDARYLFAEFEALMAAGVPSGAA